MVDRKMTPATQESFCHHFSRPSQVGNASRETQSRSGLPTGSMISADQRESAVPFPVVAQRGASENVFAFFGSFAVPQEFVQAGKISIAWNLVVLKSNPSSPARFTLIRSPSCFRFFRVFRGDLFGLRPQARAGCLGASWLSWISKSEALSQPAFR